MYARLANEAAVIPLGDKFEVRGDGILITAAHPEN